MTTSRVLGIPYLASQQATPEVTHNTALYLVEALLRGVKDRTNTPPGGPADGDTYLVGTAGTGAWAGKSNHVAIYAGNAWRFVPGFDSDGAQIAIGAEHEGMQVYVQDEDRQYLWTGAAWVALLGTAGGVPPIYEQGTFTPTFTFTTPGDLAVVYTAQDGRYSRIFDEVFVDYRLSGTPTYTTAAGTARIAGLPFTSTPTFFPIGCVAPGPTGPVAPAGTASVITGVLPSDTKAFVQAFNESGAATTLGTTHFVSGVSFSLIGSMKFRRV